MKPTSLSAQDMQIDVHIGQEENLPQIPQEDTALISSSPTTDPYELRFEGMSDQELTSSEQGQDIAFDIAYETNSMENLNRIMKNPNFYPAVLREGCENEIATADTWHMALENMQQQMEATPVELPADYPDCLKLPPENRPTDRDRDITSAAGWILRQDSSARPLPFETKQLAVHVRQMSKDRRDELSKLRQDALRAAGWQEI